MELVENRMLIDSEWDDLERERKWGEDLDDPELDEEEDLLDD